MNTEPASAKKPFLSPVGGTALMSKKEFAAAEAAEP
jgi:hypothetical protein